MGVDVLLSVLLFYFILSRLSPFCCFLYRLFICFSCYFPYISHFTFVRHILFPRTSLIFTSHAIPALPLTPILALQDACLIFQLASFLLVALCPKEEQHDPDVPSHPAPSFLWFFDCPQP